MELLGASIEGTYNLVPPPQVGGIFKRIKRGVKKAGRVAKKVGKKGVKVAVKVHTKPLKLAAKAGKYALKGVAKLAAKPVVYVFKKLARRRAGFLAYKARKTTNATPAEKREAGLWAINKVNKAGPIGKLAVRILKFVDAHKSAGVGLETIAVGYEQDAAACGMTGAEIAAAATSIVVALTALMKTLNKPGQAPANPAAAAKESEPAEDTQPVIESAEEEGGEVTEDEAAGAFTSRAHLKKLASKWRRNRFMVPPPPTPRRRRARF